MSLSKEGYLCKGVTKAYLNLSGKTPSASDRLVKLMGYEDFEAFLDDESWTRIQVTGLDGGFGGYEFPTSSLVNGRKERNSRGV